MDAQNALGRLDREGQAMLAAIAQEHARLCDEYDELEREFHHKANPMLAAMAED
jgi:hypothetical protein